MQFNTDPQYETTEDQLHDTEADDGTLLLFHECSLLVADSKEENEDWNHASGFWSRVNCKGNSCNIIIDSGSMMNVISQLPVEKLQLPTVKHRRPYKVAWVDNYSIPVRHQCVVPFRVGKYEDTIQCDVIPMNVTHILFWRPWLKKKKTNLRSLLIMSATLILSSGKGAKSGYLLCQLSLHPHLRYHLHFPS